MRTITPEQPRMPSSQQKSAYVLQSTAKKTKVVDVNMFSSQVKMGEGSTFKIARSPSDPAMSPSFTRNSAVNKPEFTFHNRRPSSTLQNVLKQVKVQDFTQAPQVRIEDIIREVNKDLSLCSPDATPQVQIMSPKTLEKSNEMLL